MYYVYKRGPSTGAVALAKALGGKRLRSQEKLLSRLKPGDVVVFWGSSISPGLIPEGVTTINNNTPITKRRELDLLREAGVPTVEVHDGTPEEGILPTFVDTVSNLNALLATDPATTELLEDFVRAANDAIAKCNEAMSSTDRGIWLPRANNHRSGRDLINPPARPDFWVRKVNIKEEYRVHSFDGRSIRLAKKVKDEHYNRTPHPWIRTLSNGWRFSYVGTDNQAIRDVAHQAVAAVGLTFGGVDIAITDDDQIIALEVNRTPGLKNGTSKAYARAIKRYVDEEENDDVQREDH